MLALLQSGALLRVAQLLQQRFARQRRRRQAVGKLPANPPRSALFPTQDRHSRPTGLGAFLGRGRGNLQLRRGCRKLLFQRAQPLLESNPPFKGLRQRRAEGIHLNAGSAGSAPVAAPQKCPHTASLAGPTRPH